MTPTRVPGQAYDIGGLLVLTMFQPFASLCVLPFKGRNPIKQHVMLDWTPHVRPPVQIAIHASERWDYDVERWCLKHTGYLRSVGIESPAHQLPLGAIVGLATVSDVVDTWRLGQPYWAFFDQELASFNGTDYAGAQWTWRLKRVMALADPVPVPGRGIVAQLHPIAETLAGAIFESLAQTT